MAFGGGCTAWRRALGVGAALVWVGAVGPVGAKPSAPKAASAAVTHSKNVKTATVVSVDEQAVHLTLADGTALDAELRPSSLFLKGGVVAKPTDFAGGAKVVVRTRTRASDGAVSVVLLCDPQTAAAIDAYRRRPLVGRVQSEDDKYWVIKPEGGGDGMPLTVHITAKTAFRKGGADATAAAFPVGAAVTVVTRGLPSGLLMGSIITDSPADATAAKAALKTVSLSGLAVDVQPEKNLLVIAPKGKPRQTVAVTDATKIRVRKQDGVLKDVTPGMRVSARLGHQKDGEGHWVATSLSAYDSGAVSRKKLPAKKAP